MKRSHNYSSSDSDLDDNVEVEKDSCDENGCVEEESRLVFQMIVFVCLTVAESFDLLLFHLSDSLILTAPCHPPPPPRFKPEKGAEG